MATKGKKKNSAFDKPVNVSEDLAKVLGQKTLTRGQVTKKLWEYIKANNLQDPKNKRNIIPDALLSKVLGKNAIDMFKMTAVVSKHVTSA